jgi:HTH-type transcriptional regulator, glycine betaine synthesis regulator
MTPYSIPSQKKDSGTEELSEWEVAVVDLFLNAVQSVGLPKSLGQIYGLLFCRDHPLSMDEVMNLLGISKGSASQGLRSLRQLGAVSSVFERGDRKERFVAEIRLRKLVAGFLKEQAEPHMEKGISRLDNLRKLLSAEKEDESKKRGVRREEILSGWHRQMSRLLPWVKMIVGKSDRLTDKSSD